MSYTKEANTCPECWTMMIEVEWQVICPENCWGNIRATINEFWIQSED